MWPETFTQVSSLLLLSLQMAGVCGPRGTRHPICSGRGHDEPLSSTDAKPSEESRTLKRGIAATHSHP